MCYRSRLPTFPVTLITSQQEHFPFVWPSHKKNVYSGSGLGATSELESSPGGLVGPKREVYLGLQVIAFLLVQTAVHNVHNVINCDGGFSNVGGQYNLAYPKWRLLEYGLLVHHGDIGVHWWIARCKRASRTIQPEELHTEGKARIWIPHPTLAVIQLKSK